MRCSSYTKACDAARQNAAYFGRPYRVFQDTSLCWNCERLTPGNYLAMDERLFPGQIYYPPVSAK